MSDNYTDILLEDINDKFERIVEAVGQLHDKVNQKSNQSDIDEIKADLKIVKAAVTDMSRQVNEHEERLHKLKIA